ncbi:hypothetical protein R1flu_005592 [Riccia fluitans]|uniref:Uncharacterized protein n=1 Tax=Riccia fluitans TaxID=41844 RepID=A0ABD1YTM0_9MARC
MNGIRRRSKRQSDVPPEEPSSQCHTRATSSIIEVLPNEAMEMIDLLVQDEETNSRVGAIGDDPNLAIYGNPACSPYSAASSTYHWF